MIDGNYLMQVDQIHHQGSVEYRYNQQIHDAGEKYIGPFDGSKWSTSHYK